MAKIDDALVGLLQCDCDLCYCTKLVDRTSFFDQGGWCEECMAGYHEEEKEGQIDQAL